MGTRQKHSILANEISRRLYNIEGFEREEKEEEVVEVIEDYTRQLKNSGWSRKECRQIVTSQEEEERKRGKRVVQECCEFTTNQSKKETNR